MLMAPAVASIFASSLWAGFLALLLYSSQIHPCRYASAVSVWLHAALSCVWSFLACQTAPLVGLHVAAQKQFDARPLVAEGAMLGSESFLTECVWDKRHC